MASEATRLQEYDVLGDGISFVRLINTMGSDVEIVNGARVSFGKRREELDEKDKVLIQYLADERHTSPFEHVAFTFHIKCPLFVTRQWHRHRTWSYNEISRRYTEVDMEFYAPPAIREQAKVDRQASVESARDHSAEIAKISAHNEASLRLYNELLESGVCREQARGVLPQNMMVTFWATVDLSNLIHFLDLRDSEHAQWEIREYAKAIKKLIAPIVPNVMRTLEKSAPK